MRFLSLKFFPIAFLVISQIGISTSFAKEHCERLYSKLGKANKDDPVFFEDSAIGKVLNDSDASFEFFGQSPVSRQTREKAMTILNQEDGLGISNIQKAHRELSGGHANLNFRGNSDAKVLGNVSFRSFSALNEEERKSLK